MTPRCARFTVLAALATTACGHDFEPPDRGERVRAAEAVYSDALFDTVSWSSDSVRAQEGNGVYAAKCVRCHGPLGRGDTEYARTRGIEVPSLVEREWPLASMDSLRRTIFVGHEGGMPVFGVGGITPREIDASAYYVLHTLRPEVLRESRGRM